MPAPSWILLAWSGFAATCAAALTGALSGGSAPATWSLLPEHRSDTWAFTATLLAGVVFYPLIYGIIFEVVGRADLRLGVIIGLVHAVVAAAVGAFRSPRVALRLALMHLVYAVVIAFLYVTP